MRTCTYLMSALVLTVLGIGAAEAQAPTSGKISVLSIQPISTMLTVYSGEFELAMSRSATIGIGATHLGAELGEDFTYTSGDVKLRYYPEGRAFQGLSFGASVGMSRVAASSQNTQDSGSETKPSIGVMLDYGWLLGAQESFYVGLGAGAKAVFVGHDDFDAPGTFRYPTARLSVGWAF